jgi:hypothetical protein
MLTNKAGKQEAKDDEDERETEQHGSFDDPRVVHRWTGADGERLTSGAPPCQEGRALDIFIDVHNNPFMNAAKLTPVAVLINLASSRGATG